MEEFERDHLDERIENINVYLATHRTAGQRAADFIARHVGSWRFIIVQSIVLAFWVVLNFTAWVESWDPYPFILMNLFLSLQAAYTAPIIIMSQNRQTERDRLDAHHDFLVDRKAEQEIRAILERLDRQDEGLDTIAARLAEVRNELARLNGKTGKAVE